MHSALKHAGRPLYDYARAGIDIARPARQIEILRIELLAIEGSRLRLQVDCSKGTYIRVLAEEIGRRLGCGAWLAGLRRNRTGGFGVDAAYTLEQLQALAEDQRAACLLAPEALVAELPRLDLDAHQTEWIWHGRSPELVAGSVGPPPGTLVQLFAPDGGFIGLATATADRRLLATRLMAAPPK
jgi:tRNA pseudouridine55 synthase